jgi:hypothetical protein
MRYVNTVDFADAVDSFNHSLLLQVGCGSMNEISVIVGQTQNDASKQNYFLVNLQYLFFDCEKNPSFLHKKNIFYFKKIS